MKKLLFLTIIMQLILLESCKTKELTPEQQEKRDKLTEKIEKPDFLYIPNNAQPAQGRTINLDNSFSLKVKNDTIEAYLPYYGRAYTAPIDATNLGIKFTSTDFEYSSIMKKNGTYDIKIEPKDINNQHLQGIILYLNVSNSGYGSLNVQSTNRQNISFYGTLE